jgi:hypothetical protein
MNIHQIPNKNDLIIIENEKMLELRKTLLSIEQQDKIILTASNEGS